MAGGWRRGDREPLDTLGVLLGHASSFTAISQKRSTERSGPDTGPGPTLPFGQNGYHTGRVEESPSSGFPQKKDCPKHADSQAGPPLV